MSLLLIRSLVLWTVLWFISFGFYDYLLLKFKVVKEKIVTIWLRAKTFYYFLLSIVAFLIFRNFLAYLGYIKITSWLWIVVFVVLVYIVYFIFRSKASPPERMIHEMPTVQSIRLEGLYVLPKSIELLFQQIMVWSLLGIVAQNFDENKKIILWSTLFFFIVHVPLLLVMRKNISYLFVFGSLLGGLLFSSTIVLIANGPVWSYIFHWSFYLLFGISFWICPTLERKIFIESLSNE